MLFYMYAAYRLELPLLHNRTYTKLKNLPVVKAFEGLLNLYFLGSLRVLVTREENFITVFKFGLRLFYQR